MARLREALEYIEEVCPFGTEDFEECFLLWIKFYSRLLHCAVHMIHEDDGEALWSEERVDCHLLFEETIADYDMRVESTPSAKMPTFEAIWMEMIVGAIEIDYEFEDGSLKICEYIFAHGRRLAGHQAYAFAFSCFASAKYIQFFQSFMEQQPVYTDLPSNFPESYALDGTTGVTDFSLLKDVVRLTAAGDATHLMDYFGPLLNLTISTFEATLFTPSQAHINVLQDACVQAWTRLTSNLMNGKPIYVRRNMAQINVRGLVDLLSYKCRQLLNEPESSHKFGWSLCVWFLRHFYKALLNCDWTLEESRAYIRNVSSGHLDLDKPDSTPMMDFRLPKYMSYIVNIQELERASQIEDLEDVRFVPDGEPLDPKNYTDPMTNCKKEELCVICQCELDGEVVKLRACGHILHLECVRAMINGVEPSSNLCPLDRQQICPRRLRRRAP